MTRLPDLSSTSQAALVLIVFAALALVLGRGAHALHRKGAHRYPAPWTPAQIRLLEHIRITIGFALILTWSNLLALSPAMPQSWPFSFREVLLTIVLLFLTNAWILLVIPRHWQSTFAGRMSFGRVVGFVVVWWTIMIGAATFGIFRSATEAMKSPVIMFGTYA